MDIESESSEQTDSKKWKKMRKCDFNKCKKLFKINEECIKILNCGCIFHKNCLKNR